MTRRRVFRSYRHRAVVREVIDDFDSKDRARALVRGVPPRRTVFIGAFGPNFEEEQRVFATGRISIHLYRRTNFVVSAFFEFLRRSIQLCPATLARCPLTVRVVCAAAFVSRPIRSAYRLASSRVGLFNVKRFSASTGERFRIVRMLLTVPVQVPRVQIFCRRKEGILENRFRCFSLANARNCFLHRLS